MPASRVRAGGAGGRRGRTGAATSSRRPGRGSPGEAGARMLRECLTREVFARIVAALDADQPELRASLAVSQMMGLVVARYVVLIQPLASLPPDRVVALVGPTLQAYLTGPLRDG